MGYIKGCDRRAGVIFPDYVEDHVEADAPVRFIDSFVDKLDLQRLGFVRAEPAQTGAPGYDPSDLLKLYVYGYFYHVRSSRRLDRECRYNVEVMWLICKLTPDFRTISDFRKNNKEAISKVFKEFNKFCMELKLFSMSYISIDGSKFKAVNAKDRNFTLSKLDDRIKRLEEHIAVYMKELDECDGEEGDRVLSKADKQHKLEVCQKRKERYEGYRDRLEETGESQLSTTDPDSRLMKANEGFCVGYNVQTAVDAKNHMIAGFQVTNKPTDHGQLTNVATEVKNDFDVEILETTADKGYKSPEDHANALASGIVPNVIQRDGGNTETVEFEYQEQTITEEQKASKKPEDLKACLQAGVISDAYKGILSDPVVKEKRTIISCPYNSEVTTMTPEQMRSKALEGYFVRDAARNLVYCPQGKILRQKSTKRNGNIRYYNKLACQHCKHKCTSTKYKEIDFSKDTLIKPANSKKTQKTNKDSANKLKPPKTCIVNTIVQYTLHLDANKMDNRKCLSEHPFGTIKRSLSQYYFLLKGIPKVKAEMSLFCLSYNLRRAINIIDVPALIAALH